MNEDDPDFHIYDVESDLAEWKQRLLGKVYEFEDNGDKLEIVQLKRRDSGVWVTYHAHQGPGIPRKLQMHIEEFVENYGHLFGFD